MPSINSRLSPWGPIVTAYIGVSPQASAMLQKHGLPIPQTQPGMFLVDTGASATVVDPTFIANLGLTPKNFIEVHTPSTNGQPVLTPIYDVSIMFASTTPQSGAGTPVQIPYIKTVSAAGSHLQSQGIDGLIGRDVLEHCILIYNGPEAGFTLAW